MYPRHWKLKVLLSGPPGKSPSNNDGLRKEWKLWMTEAPLVLSPPTVRSGPFAVVPRGEASIRHPILRALSLPSSGHYRQFSSVEWPRVLCFLHVILSDLHGHSVKTQVRPREVKGLALGHTARKREDLKTICSGSKPLALFSGPCWLNACRRV